MHVHHTPTCSVNGRSEHMKTLSNDRAAACAPFAYSVTAAGAFLGTENIGG